MRSLPPTDPATLAPLPRARARRRPSLSRRRVRTLVQIGQLWIDRADVVWQIRQIHRKDLRGDGTVALQRLGSPDGPWMTVSFAELGAGYQHVGAMP